MSRQDTTGSSGGGRYRAYGSSGFYQNQPGLNDWNRDVGGRWHSQNVYAPQTLDDAQKAALAEWAQLARQYPQYTNHANLQFLSNQAMDYGHGFHAPANGDPTTGRVALNNASLPEMSPGYLRYVLAKELGQAVAERTVGTKSRADEYMNAIGYKGDRSMRTSDQLVGAGATWGQETAPNAMNWEGYRTYPQDLYGLDFARALGRVEPRNTNPGLPPAIIARFQEQGLLPRRYAAPTTPQQPPPNVSDFGRRIDGAQIGLQALQQKQTEALLRSLASQQQRGPTQRDQANAARRGGTRNF